MVDTTNQMFIDDYGNHMTRCWSKRKKKINGKVKIVTVMYVIPTDPSEIRRKSNVVWEPEIKVSDSRRQSTGSTSGWKQN